MQSPPFLNKAVSGIRSCLQCRALVARLKARARLTRETGGNDNFSAMLLSTGCLRFPWKRKAKLLCVCSNELCAWHPPRSLHLCRGPMLRAPRLTPRGVALTIHPMDEGVSSHGFALETVWEKCETGGLEHWPAEEGLVCLSSQWGLRAAGCTCWVPQSRERRVYSAAEGKRGSQCPPCPLIPKIVCLTGPLSEKGGWAAKGLRETLLPCSANTWVSQAGQALLWVGFF